MTLPTQRKLFDAETWLAHRLGDFGHVFQGVTDSALRRQRIREAILEGGLDQVVCGKNPTGKTETFGQVYERLFGEPITGTRKVSR